MFGWLIPYLLAACTIPTAFVGGLALWGVKQAQVVGFGIAVLATTAPPCILTHVCHFIIGFLPKSQQESGHRLMNMCVYWCLNWCWWATFVLCPWVQLQNEGLPEFHAGLKAKHGKPRIVILNHCSFLDSFVSLAAAPFSEICYFKTMASAHLKKMPVVGTVARGCGHLWVPFKEAGDSGGFSVDKEAAAKVQQQLVQHVRDGNIAVWYPEGTINPGDATQLQTFRAGGFSLPVDVDCEIWCLVHVGNQVCWGKKAVMGGTKSNIRCRAFRICESSKQLASQATVEKDTPPERAQALFLANHCKDKMQAAMDEMVKDGWPSVLKKEKKSD